MRNLKMDLGDDVDVEIIRKQHLILNFPCMLNTIQFTEKEALKLRNFLNDVFRPMNGIKLREK